jgi:hypothetical protein
VTEPEEIMSILIRNPKAHLRNLVGVVEFKVRDQMGNSLLLNPQYSTMLRFPPYAQLGNSMYTFYDSLTQTYSRTAYSLDTRRIDLGNQNEDGLVNDYDIDNNFIDSTQLSKNHNLANKDKINHKGWKMGRQEVIAYELSLMSSGWYFINWKDKDENLQAVDIIVDLEIDDKSRNDAKNKEHAKAFLFLFTLNPISHENFYITAEKTNNGRYRFKEPSGNPHFSLKLPLARKYTLLGYFVEGEQCYFYKNNNISLQSNNLFKIKLKKMKLNKILKELKSL